MLKFIALFGLWLTHSFGFMLLIQCFIGVLVGCALIVFSANPPHASFVAPLIAAPLQFISSRVIPRC